VSFYSITFHTSATVTYLYNCDSIKSTDCVVVTDFRSLIMADSEENNTVVPLIEPQDMTVVPVQTSERRLSSTVLSVNNQIVVMG